MRAKTNFWYHNIPTTKFSFPAILIQLTSHHKNGKTMKRCSNSCTFHVPNERETKSHNQRTIYAATHSTNWSITGNWKTNDINQQDVKTNVKEWSRSFTNSQQLKNGHTCKSKTQPISHLILGTRFDTSKWLLYTP